MKAYRFITMLAVLGLCQVGSAALVAEWNFDNSSNLGEDSVGTKDLIENGTYTAPTYTANGISGGAALFTESSNDGVQTPTYIFPGPSFTFALFAKPSDTNISTLVTSRNRIGGFDITTIGGKWATKTYNYDKQSQNTYGPAVTTDWTHIAVSFAASSGPDASGNYTGALKFYLDGVAVAQNSSAVYFPGGTNLRIGTSWPLTSVYRGLMDEIQLYDTALSDSEIAALAVPEPATISLLGIAAGGLLLLRKTLRK